MHDAATWATSSAFGRWPIMAIRRIILLLFMAALRLLGVPTNHCANSSVWASLVICALTTLRKLGRRQSARLQPQTDAGAHGKTAPSQPPAGACRGRGLCPPDGCAGPKGPVPRGAAHTPRRAWSSANLAASAGAIQVRIGGTGARPHDEGGVRLWQLLLLPGYNILPLVSTQLQPDSAAAWQSLRSTAARTSRHLGAVCLSIETP